ncbi:MAG: hypothetical protein N2439_03475, partial [Anaerolineae bacterium]|nr:hypothetical protein [Anaerolineae bacterium]
FGAPTDPTPEQAYDFRYTLHAITSAYRPNATLVRIARREVAGLPVTQNNRKGNYWHGQGRRPELAARETVHVASTFTLGSLWDAHASQHTRFQLVVRQPNAAPLSFTAGHPRQSDHNGQKTGIGYRDGTGRYVQSAQIGPTAVIAAFIPPDDPADHVFLRFTEGHAPEPVGRDWVIRLAGATVVLRPFGGDASVGPSLPHGRNNSETIEIFKVAGQRVGFVVEVLTAPELERGLDAWLAAHPPPEAAQWLSAGELRYRLRDGRELRFVFQPDPAGDRHGDRLARVELDGQPMDLNWPWVWGGPLVRLEGRVLSVTDGREGFGIDFTGDLPRYRPFTANR